MRSWQTRGVSARVTLSGELSGEYVVDEIIDDGRIVLRPEHQCRGDPRARVG